MEDQTKIIDMITWDYIVFFVCFHLFLYLIIFLCYCVQRPAKDKERVLQIILSCLFCLTIIGAIYGSNHLGSSNGDVVMIYLFLIFIPIWGVFCLLWSF